MEIWFCNLLPFLLYVIATWRYETSHIEVFYKKVLWKISQTLLGNASKVLKNRKKYWNEVKKSW